MATNGGSVTCAGATLGSRIFLVECKIRTARLVCRLKQIIQHAAGREIVMLAMLKDIA